MLREKICWSQDRRFSYRFAPYFACAKLQPFPMVSACALAPWPLKTPSKPRFVFGYFSTNVIFILLGSPWGYGSVVPQWGHKSSRFAEKVFADVSNAIAFPWFALLRKSGLALYLPTVLRRIEYGVRGNGFLGNKNTVCKNRHACE